MIGGQAAQPIVFSDLDGTLLDHHTYDWSAAAPALDLLRRRKIPLVFCSSKTRAEVEPLRQAIGNCNPFIVENGGAIFIPDGCFDPMPPDAAPADGYRVIALGAPYETLRQTLQAVAAETGVTLEGAGDMTPDSFGRLTGMPPDAARRAMARSYDEPFVIQAPADRHAAVLAAIAARGFRWTRGGRFYHVTGEHDKGKAVARLVELYRRHYGTVQTIGIGDSFNDLPLLRAVDHPVLVRRPYGGYDPSVALDPLDYADGVGPVGWNSAVLRLIGGKTPPPSAPAPA